MCMTYQFISSFKFSVTLTHEMHILTLKGNERGMIDEENDEIYTTQT